MSKFILTSDNYFSPEAQQLYCGSSQFKDFIGTYGRMGCEFRALEMLRGNWQEEESTALLVGSFVDAFWEGSLEKFKSEHKDIFTKQGELKAPYKQAETIIERTLRDKKFCQYMSGEKQVIMTGSLFDMDWKIKIDSYHKDVCIVDLKVMRSIFEPLWVRDLGHLDFIRYWGYDWQAGLYQKIVELNTGKKLPFYIAAVTKSDFPQIRIIQVPQEWMDESLHVFEANAPRIKALKNGELLPVRCEQCDCCNSTYEIDKPISAYDLLGGI